MRNGKVVLSGLVCFSHEGPNIEKIMSYKDKGQRISRIESKRQAVPARPKYPRPVVQHVQTFGGPLLDLERFSGHQHMESKMLRLVQDSGPLLYPRFDSVGLCLNLLLGCDSLRIVMCFVVAVVVDQDMLPLL